MFSIFKKNTAKKKTSEILPLNVKPKMDIGEREVIAKSKQDFNEAIALAKTYNESCPKGECFDARERALHWLIQAIKYQENGFIELQKAIDLKEFLKTYKILYSAGFLFEHDALPLLFLLKNTIVELYLAPSFPPETVNSLLAGFIANNNTLKRLDIGTIASQNPYPLLNPTHMRYIAEGLKTNISLEYLNISDQPIGDEGLILILNALASNPRTNLKVLNIYNTGITTKGQQAIEEFLKTNKTLESVNVRYNKGVSSEKINGLTYRNKMTNAEWDKEKEHKGIMSSISITCAMTP